MSAAEITDLRRRGEFVKFSDPQLNLIKRTICRPKQRECTNDELSLFVGQCLRTGLDPFSRQIYAIFRWNSKEKAEEMTVQTAIDGFRVIAERSGTYMGKVSTHWCGEDEQWREVWLEKEPPKAAKVVVRKFAAGQVVEIPAVAHYAEYATPTRGLWPTMPANQLAKCTEALALRQAFPNDLSGLYTDDEMEQAEVRTEPAEVARELAEGEPPEAEVVAERPSTDEFAALNEAIAVAGIDDEKLQVLLASVGVDCTEDLDKAAYDALLAAIAQHMGGAQ